MAETGRPKVRDIVGANVKGGGGGRRRRKMRRDVVPADALNPVRHPENSYKCAARLRTEERGRGGRAAGKLHPLTRTSIRENVPDYCRTRSGVPRKELKDIKRSLA